MYVAEGEKVPDDCILYDRIYFLRHSFAVGVLKFDSLPMATADFPSSGFLFGKKHSTRKEAMIIHL